MRRRRGPLASAPRRLFFEPSECDDVETLDEQDAADECRGDDARVTLPRLVKPMRRGRDSPSPHWMGITRHAVQRTSHTSKRRASKLKTKPPHALSLLDEQMLVLCRSAMQRNRENNAPLRSLDPPAPVYGYESIYAAIQVQRFVRGVQTRQRLAAFDGPRFQRAASNIQFALRRVMVARRVVKRWMGKRHRCATRIQAWYRGCRCRDQVQCERARVLVERITMFQRRFRGYRFWNLVAALLAQRRSNAATQIQRCYRGMADRRRVREMRQERARFAVELREMSHVHRRQARCKGCHASSWNEETLFACFMVRFIGLHDLHGAKMLGLEGVHSFPSSARFCFMYSILSQVLGEDLEISMAFLRRAEVVLRINDADIQEVERRYLFPALQLSMNDVAVLLDLAIVSQCTNKISRATSFYRLALEQSPSDYRVPGYLHRVDMLDRLLLNYHRFCSIFSSRQVNVLAKVVPIAKRGEQVRVLVTRHSQITRIQCTGDEDSPRFNSVYLTDDEVFRLLANKGGSDDDEEENYLSQQIPMSGKGESWKSSVKYASTRRLSRMNRGETQAAPKGEEDVGRGNIITQLYQSEFRGLIVKPVVLASPSEGRSKVQITREHAERLLRDLLFIDPFAELKAELSALQVATEAGSAVSLHRVLLYPSIMKERMMRKEETLRSHAIVNLQRVFRGFRVRAQIRRETLIHTIRQQQVDHLYARLHRNFQFREKRRLAATAIQRVCKGYTTRRLMTTWRFAATEIQRIFRGHRGRKRAIAFREGNLTFYMAERVYQRGTSISNKSIVLVIDKCGLSFRLEAYDMVACTMYPGFISNDSTMALIRYENWSYAQRLIGRELWLHGNRGFISAVACINQVDGQCIVDCQFECSAHDVNLADCIQAINLRNTGLNGLDAEQLLPPLTVDDTSRIVSCIVQRLALVPSIPMATKELQRKVPGALILTVMPPPKVHYVFSKTESVAIKVSHSAARTSAKLPASLIRQVAFPVVDGYRGVSIGKRLFRQKCVRHSIHFTKCRCVLPLTTAPAYIQAITLALTPPPPPSNQGKD